MVCLADVLSLPMKNRFAANARPTDLYILLLISALCGREIQFCGRPPPFTPVMFFDVLNHPNFGFPDNGVSSPTLGLIFYGEQAPNCLLGVGNNGSSRMIQLKAEMKF